MINYYNSEFEQNHNLEPSDPLPITIPKGLTVLSGLPKVGKSLLALQITLATIEGKSVCGLSFGHGPVSHFALQDNKRRVYDRLGKSGYENLLTPYLFSIYTSGSLPPLDENGTDKLRDLLREFPALALVVIDGFELVCEKNSTRALRKLNRFADENNIRVLAVTHFRKPSVETNILLSRPFLSQIATLAIPSHGFREKIVLDKKTLKWELYSGGGPQ